MKEVIRTRPDGTVQAPKGPGLGLEIDWKAMEKATIHTITS
jgi:L-alanine-DL-glutamate epimerase-like enolase superfamily enzyme